MDGARRQYAYDMRVSVINPVSGHARLTKTAALDIEAGVYK